MAITVVKVRTEQAVEQVSLPFATERRDDDQLAKGSTRTITAGRTGTANQTVTNVYADDVLESRTVLSTDQTAAPVTRVLAVGTAAPAPRQSSNSASADGLNWGALAKCESGGNPRAVSSSGAYRGLYQFSLSTWRSVGGQGDPIDNSAGEQTYRAQVLYNRSGAGQWPHCGRYL